MKTGLGLGSGKLPAAGDWATALVNVPVNANEKPASLRSRAPRGRAFALVATLLMITVITGAAVAFFQSTRIERLVTRNYADLARARMAAEAAADDGRDLVVALFSNYPDSATAWIRPAGGANTELCAYFFRTTDTNSRLAIEGFLTNGTNAAVPASQPVSLFAYPLASGANATNTANLASTANLFTNTNTTGGQPGLSTANSIDLNQDRWIGFDSPQSRQPALRAKWVEVLQDPTAQKNTNLNTAGRPINPAIARYAYWMEDESFRVNLNWSGATPRGQNSVGQSPADLGLQGIFSGSPATLNNLANGIVTLKLDLQANIPSPNSMALANTHTATTLANFKYFFTAHSSALNLSRGGVQRVNLNQVVSDSTDATTIRSQLDRLIATINNRYAMPDFGQRFYRTDASRNLPGSLNNRTMVPDTAADPHAKIYLNKLAANIRDYIDTDSQPTILQNNAPAFSVLLTPNPTQAWDSSVVGMIEQANPVAAVGQEAVPLLTEYALRVRLLGFSPPPEGDNRATFRMELIHYFEFWNPYQKTITAATLGNAPYLRVANMFGWEGGEEEALPAGRNRQWPLSDFSGFTIPPGDFAVCTTDPNPLPSLAIPDGKLFKGGDPDLVVGMTTDKSGTFYQIVPKTGTKDGRAGTGVSDYETHLVIGNDTGYLSSFSALPMPYNLTVNDAPDGGVTPSSPLGQPLFYPRGGSLRGNGSGTAGSGSQTGDPRSLNEQLSIQRYRATADSYTFGADEDQTRFYDTGLNNKQLPEKSSLGNLGSGTSAFVDPSGGNPSIWPDWGGTGFGNNQPFAFIRDGAMQTIGELGHIYDPVRLPNANAPRDVKFSRGGARTLKIGQKESYNLTDNSRGLWGETNASGEWGGGTQTSTSRNWTSWRLTDVFCVNPPDRNGNNLIDADELARIDGQININGVQRDGGRAIRALLWGLQYQNSPDPGAATTAAKSVFTNNLITALQTRQNANPSNIFWERGEISELDLFSTGTTLTTPTPANMAQTLDRGREELVRRLMDMICTKGNTYTVYAIGQALDPLTGRPLASQKLKRTIRVTGLFNNPSSTPAMLPLPADASFTAAASGTDNPLPGGTRVQTDRFRRPARWTVDVLAENWN